MIFRPKLVDRLVISEVVPLFFVMVVVFTSIILIVASADLIKYLTQGVPLIIVLQLIEFNILPWLVPTFPMATLLSTIVGFARLSTQSEIVALFAAGIPFKRIAAAAIAFSLVITAVAVFTNDTVSPYANRKFDALKANLSHDFNATTKPFDLPAARDGSNRLVLLTHVEGGYDIKTESLKNVYLLEVNPSTGDVLAAVHAPEAVWTGGKNFRLVKPYVLSSTGVYGQLSSLVVKDLHQLPDTIPLLENDVDALNFRQLFTEITEERAAGGASQPTVRDAEVSLWDKISLPIACVVFSIIGAPLGLRPQRNAALGVAITLGIVISIAYYVLYQYMFVLGASGHVDPAFAAFLPDGLAVIAGIFLMRRSSS